MRPAARLRRALLAAASSLGLAATPQAAPAPRPLEIYWIDVEGGAATLIVTPAGESLLIDAGFPGGRDAARIHEVATRAAGLGSIDRVLVTHFHRDHFGGVAELAQRMPIGELLERDLATAPAAEQGQPDLEAYRAATVGKRTRVAPGTLALRQAPDAARLEVEILGANDEFPAEAGAAAGAAWCQSARDRAPDASDNRNSVVTSLRFGDFRFFDGGDLTWNAEARLVCPRNLVGGPVDVFQIDHHGVDNSNNPVLVRSLAPTVVVVNNGPSKGGEPESFAAVQATPSVRAVYQLHRNLRSPQSNTLDERILNAGEDCQARFLKLTVEPDGRRYWLWVPSTGHRTSYAVRHAGTPEPRPAGRVEVVARDDERRVDVAIDGAPFTSYIWPESLMKPALWPIRDAAGRDVTRGFPLAPRPGERVDHPHQVGLWFSYGDVNGVDFWNNSTARSKEEQARMGTTVHRRVLQTSGGDAGRLTVLADWLLPGAELALQETTAFVFRPLADGRLIERTATLVARRAVTFKDNKEGLFGLRTARSLEQPAEEKAAVIGADYRPAASAPLDNTGVSGLYHSSEGRSGDAVWGTRGRWVALAGQVDGAPVVVAILDHPKNPGAPTYWHARGYGLFAANPLGQKEFSGGRESLGFSLAAGGSAVFRYQVAVLSGSFSAARIEELYRAFAERRAP